MGIEDRVAIITGATGGLGRVVTHRLAEHGARLALFGRNAERLAQLASELFLPEDRYLAQAINLTDPVDAQAAADAVLVRYTVLDHCRLSLVRIVLEAVSKARNPMAASTPQ